MKLADGENLQSPMLPLKAFSSPDPMSLFNFPIFGFLLSPLNKSIVRPVSVSHFSVCLA